MNKRERIKLKYGGLCAYSGKPLDDKWQIDHAVSKNHVMYKNRDFDLNHESNLLPVMQVINHYKRYRTLEEFREFLKDFHIRLAKLPKKTVRKATERRIVYMNTIAQLLDIEQNKPFCGKFYFETLGSC